MTHPHRAKPSTKQMSPIQTPSHTVSCHCCGVPFTVPLTVVLTGTLMTATWPPGCCCCWIWGCCCCWIWGCCCWTWGCCCCWILGCCGCWILGCCGCWISGCCGCWISGCCCWISGCCCWISGDFCWILGFSSLTWSCCCVLSVPFFGVGKIIFRIWANCFQVMFLKTKSEWIRLKIDHFNNDLILLVAVLLEVLLMCLLDPTR